MKRLVLACTVAAALTAFGVSCKDKNATPEVPKAPAAPTVDTKGATDKAAAAVDAAKTDAKNAIDSVKVPALPK
jgi:hypothetical protein